MRIRARGRPDGDIRIAARLLATAVDVSLRSIAAMAMERRPQGRKGLASRADDVALVVVIGVVAFVALQVVSAVIGTILFFVKLAVVAVVVAVVAAVVARRRS